MSDDTTTPPDAPREAVPPPAGSGLARRAEDALAQHDLCHDLHGKVGAEDFSAGCAAEQRRLYGRAPDADEAGRLRVENARLSARVARLEGAMRLASDAVESGQMVGRHHVQRMIRDALEGGPTP